MTHRWVAGVARAEILRCAQDDAARHFRIASKNPFPSAFAGGDLAASESLLTSAIAKSATAEAYVLRGCARYTRAMLSRTPDALLPSAADDFRAALRINAALRLSDGAFSPKLVAFFENVRKGK